MIKDCVVIDEGAVLRDDMVLPPFTRWGGSPAKLVEELPESMAYVSSTKCKQLSEPLLSESCTSTVFFLVL